MILLSIKIIAFFIEIFEKTLGFWKKSVHTTTLVYGYDRTILINMVIFK